LVISHEDGTLCGFSGRTVTAPPQAAAAGYTRLAFLSDFNNDGTLEISPDRVSAGYQWYPAVQGTPTYTISNSELVVTADPTPNGGGFSTVITEVKSLPDSSVFRYAYFEAKMKYSNTNPFSFNPQTSRWPSFWSLNSNWRNRTVNFQEIDFQEAIPMGGTSTNKPAGSTVQFPQSTHTWPANFGSGEISPSNTFPVATNVPAIPGGNPGCDFSVYHRYGMLWTPNSIQFFFDDVGYQTIDVSRGASGTGGLGANPDGYNLECAGDPLLVIIGTGAQWPCTWDWVRVWSRPLTVGSEFLPNAAMTGGANGSPGTMPTSMVTTNLGLTRTISSSEQPIRSLACHPQLYAGMERPPAQGTSCFILRRLRQLLALFRPRFPRSMLS
jgi:hypothetical protein